MNISNYIRTTTTALKSTIGYLCEIFKSKTIRSGIPVVILVTIAALVVHNKMLVLWTYEYWMAHLVHSITFYKKAFNATGVFPLWNNSLMCGISAIVNHPVPFSLFRILGLMGFSSIFVFTMIEYIFTVTGSLCFYFLMRLYKCGTLVSLFGALLYLNWLWKWWVVGVVECYPMALAPIIFFLCEKYERDPKYIYIFLGAIAVGLTCSTTIIHGVIFLLVFHIILMGYYLLSKTRKHYCFGAACSWFLGIILSMPTLLPQIRDVTSSQRMLYVKYILDIFGDLSWPFLSLKFFEIMQLSQINPLHYIYYGLAISSILFIKERDKVGFYWIAFFFVGFHLFLSFTQGLWNNVPIIGHLVNDMEFIRNISLIGFVITVLATFFLNGLFTMVESDWPRQNQKSVTIIIIMANVCWFFYFGTTSLLKSFIKSIYITREGSVGFGFLLFIITNIYCTKRIRKISNIIFSLILIYILAYNFTLTILSHSIIIPSSFRIPLISSLFYDKYVPIDLLPDETAIDKQDIINMLISSSSKDYFRSIDIDVLKRNEKFRFFGNQISSIFGMANIYPARYHTFFRWLINDLKVKNPEEYQLFMEKGYYTFGIGLSGIGSSFNENLLSLAGVKWILMPNNVEETRFKRIWRGHKYSLFENDKVFPRVFPVFKLTVFQDKKDMDSFMMNTDYTFFKESVPIIYSDLANFPNEFLGEDGKGNARVILYNPNEVLIETDFTQNGLLVLTDNYHPNWAATVDNVPCKIYPAYYTFRMVMVPKGRHIVRFIFNDRLFTFLTIVAFITITLMTIKLVLGWYPNIRRRFING